jgi:hypothetical protein
MPPIPIYLPIKEIKITIEYSDQCTSGGNSFDNVQKFAEFLKDNPEIGKVLGYVTKEKQRPIKK